MADVIEIESSDEELGSISKINSKLKHLKNLTISTDAKKTSKKAVNNVLAKVSAPVRKGLPMILNTMSLQSTDNIQTNKPMSAKKKITVKLPSGITVKSVPKGKKPPAKLPPMTVKKTPITSNGHKEAILPPQIMHMLHSGAGSPSEPLPQSSKELTITKVQPNTPMRPQRNLLRNLEEIKRRASESPHGPTKRPHLARTSKSMITPVLDKILERFNVAARSSPRQISSNGNIPVVDVVDSDDESKENTAETSNDGMPMIVEILDLNTGLPISGASFSGVEKPKPKSRRRTRVSQVPVSNVNIPIKDNFFGVKDRQNSSDVEMITDAIGMSEGECIGIDDNDIQIIEPTIDVPKVREEPISAPKPSSSSAMNPRIVSTTTIQVDPTVLDDNSKDSDLRPPKRRAELKSSAKPKADVTISIDTTDDNSTDSVAFTCTPTYQSFIDLCFELDDSEDMKKIVEKKVKTYYSLVHSYYVKSTFFEKLVNENMDAMKKDPDSKHLFIKNIVDELKVKRNLRKGASAAKSSTVDVDGDDETKNTGKRWVSEKHIEKLEKALYKLQKGIKMLEEREVNFDEDDGSVYLLTERYKARAVRVYEKLCSLRGIRAAQQNPAVGALRRGEIGNGPGVAALTGWLLKGGLYAFPDFRDVIECIKIDLVKQRLTWTEVKIEDEAEKLFTEVGRVIQGARKAGAWANAVTIISGKPDPSNEDPELRHKLNENKALKKNIEEVINQFVTQQDELCLEPEPVEDDDDVIAVSTVADVKTEPSDVQGRTSTAETEDPSTSISTVQRLDVDMEPVAGPSHSSKDGDLLQMIGYDYIPLSV